MNTHPRPRWIAITAGPRIPALVVIILAIAALVFWRAQRARDNTPLRHPASIYGSPPAGSLYSPFALQIDPMERLLLINFEGDPDSTYVGFEPQYFDDAVNGQGLRVVAWRTDGRIDVYQQPGLRAEPAEFDIVGQGLADLMERPFDGARFEITSTGVDLYLAFEDRNGRPVVVKVKENSNKVTQPFPLLAPVGSGTVAPPALPLFFLYDFYFVRRSGTDIEVRIGERTHQLDTLPVPLDGSWMYFTRYSVDPFMIQWNPAHDGPLAPLEPDASGVAREGLLTIETALNAGHYEIQHIRAATERHEVTMSFYPPVPAIPSLRDGASAGGSFVIGAGGGIGQVTGDYEVERAVDRTLLRLHPSGGWQPAERRWTLRFIYRVASIFREWPTTYLWTAEVTAGPDGAPTMQSRWERRD
jgi:hypothetical protein